MGYGEAKSGSRLFSIPAEAIAFNFATDRMDYIAELVEANGLAGYEMPMPALLVALCRAEPGMMLDVGANTGLFTLLMAAANPMAKICSFEPLRSVRALLENNIALNSALAPRISVYDVGLSSSVGNFDFYETINDQGFVTTSSSLEMEHVAGTQVEYRKQTIATSTLDTWSEQFPRAEIKLIKVDVEGHEYAVVEGGRRTIAKHRPFMTVEMLGTGQAEPINRLLFEADYLAFAVAEDALRHCEGVRHHTDAWNHLLCPAEKMGWVLQLARRLGLRLEFA